MPSLCTTWKEAAETLMRVLIGRDVKCGEEVLRSIETGVGSGARTGWKCVFGIDTDGSREGITEAGDEGLKIVLAVGSWVEVSRTSFHPWCVF
jgi:hypothetical protein